MNLLPLSEKVLAAIEEMAAHGFSYHEIATVMFDDWADREALIEDFSLPETEAYQTYQKGFLKNQLELRQRIFKDAKNGSSPAQALAKKILDDAEFKMK